MGVPGIHALQEIFARGFPPWMMAYGVGGGRGRGHMMTPCNGAPDQLGDTSCFHCPCNWAANYVNCNQAQVVHAKVMARKLCPVILPFCDVVGSIIQIHRVMNLPAFRRLTNGGMIFPKTIHGFNPLGDIALGGVAAPVVV